MLALALAAPRRICEQRRCELKARPADHADSAPRTSKSRRQERCVRRNLDCAATFSGGACGCARRTSNSPSAAGPASPHEGNRILRGCSPCARRRRRRRVAAAAAAAAVRDVREGRQLQGQWRRLDQDARRLSAAAAALGLRDATAVDDGRTLCCRRTATSIVACGAKFNSAGTNTGGCARYKMCVCWTDHSTPPPTPPQRRRRRHRRRRRSRRRRIRRSVFRVVPQDAMQTPGRATCPTASSPRRCRVPWKAGRLGLQSRRVTRIRSRALTVSATSWRQLHRVRR